MSATWLRRDLLDRVGPWREQVHLADIFKPEDGAGWVGEQVARAEALLDLQDRVIGNFDDLDILPQKLVSFIHGGGVYLAPHFDWGKGPRALSGASLAVFAAVNAPLVSTTALLAAITAAGTTLYVGGKQENTCFTHTGFTYANVHDSFDAGTNDVIDLDRPSLLFFDQSGQLVGCGFFRPIAGDPHVFGRPLEEIHDEWFVHVAGKHTNDGGFEPSHSGGSQHHDDFWDIHIWFSRDSLGNATGIPTVGWTMAPRHLHSPPNVAHSASPGSVDNVICSGGRSSAGLYEAAPSSHHH